MCNVAVIDKNNRVKTLNVRLAANHVDYYVPLKIEEFDDRNSLALDIHINGSYRNDGELAGFTCWKKMKTADTFDTANREQVPPPAYHHTPAYGWMNDPNGMFFKDGVWHIYFQHNPYGSQWENMTWGHSTSTDLLHWTFEGDAIEPDNWGYGVQRFGSGGQGRHRRIRKGCRRGSLHIGRRETRHRVWHTATTTERPLQNTTATR